MSGIPHSSGTHQLIDAQNKIDALEANIEALSSSVLFIAGQQAGIASAMAALNSTQTTMQLFAQNTSADLGALISDVAALEQRVTDLGG